MLLALSRCGEGWSRTSLRGGLLALSRCGTWSMLQCPVAPGVPGPVRLDRLAWRNLYHAPGHRTRPPARNSPTRRAAARARTSPTPSPRPEGAGCAREARPCFEVSTRRACEIGYQGDVFCPYCRSPDQRVTHVSPRVASLPTLRDVNCQACGRWWTQTSAWRSGPVMPGAEGELRGGRAPVAARSAWRTSRRAP